MDRTLKDLLEGKPTRQPLRPEPTSGAELARVLGWVSIGVGLTIVLAPGPLTKAIGLGDHPNLGRFLGVRDLVLGVGLLLESQNTAGWVRARSIADALDVALILGGAATGAFRRGRAPIGVATGAGFSALSFWMPGDSSSGRYPNWRNGLRQSPNSLLLANPHSSVRVLRTRDVTQS